MQTQTRVKLQQSKVEQASQQPSLLLVAFQIQAPEAKQVLLAGDFTNWRDGAHPMKCNGGGVWETQFNLKPGRYQYKFIVDEQWQNDPMCVEFVANEFGTVNNVVEVK